MKFAFLIATVSAISLTNDPSKTVRNATPEAAAANHHNQYISWTNAQD